MDPRHATTSANISIECMCFSADSRAFEKRYPIPATATDHMKAAGILHAENFMGLIPAIPTAMGLKFLIPYMNLEQKINAMSYFFKNCIIFFDFCCRVGYFFNNFAP